MSSPDGTTASGAPTGVSTASIRETVGIAVGVLAPLVARGIIVRRPWAVSLAERFDLDRRAVRRLQRLRRAHGPQPLRLRVPGRSAALVLSPDDAQRVLEGSPVPFTPATREKRAALAHFQPHGVLISQGPERAVRRELNDAVLQPSVPLHGDAGRVVATVRAETAGLLGTAPAAVVGWDEVAPVWWRIVRRVVLGDAARDDHEVTDLLHRLRADANWAFAHPRRTSTRQRFLDLVAGYVERAEPGSLAHLVATTPAPPQASPVHQLPQWLFAFDAAALATVRALALLATHPAQLASARTELEGRDLSMPQELPFLRACVLEAIRLWPTTPAVLRDTTEQTTWGDTTLPAGTSLVIHAPFLHRGDPDFEPADRFSPELWVGADPVRRWPLIPFSAGPAACPGRSIVLLVTTTMLAAVLDHGDVDLVPPTRLDRHRPLPGTLSPYSLRFRTRSR